MRVIITSCLCLSIENILSICALAVSFSTLVLGFFAYRKFLSKQLKQRQLDVVCGLVEEIQKSFNIYHLKHESKLHLMQSEWKTVMDISLMPEFDRGYEKLYFFGQDDDDKINEVVNWNFYDKYYSNPLLPKKIAINLKLFNKTHWRTVKYESISKDNCIIIGCKGVIRSDTSCFYIPDSQIETCKGFKKASIDLRKSIEDWFKSNGIKDLNFTTSHQYKDKE